VARIGGHRRPLAILGMYVYSRTNGAPIGPHEGVPEPPGVYDMVAAAGELVLVLVLVLMLARGASPTSSTSRVNGFFFGPAPVPAGSVFVLGDNRGDSGGLARLRRGPARAPDRARRPAHPVAATRAVRVTAPAAANRR
jgi:hypothetical protein